MADKFYISTSIPYLNGEPHIGHLLEFIQADAIARYHKLKGEDVFYLSGTDEHGAKIVKAAESAKKDPQEFVDSLAERFRDLHKIYNTSINDFIRTTDKQKHWPGAKRLWDMISNSGDLYKGSYKGFYCVGHEAFMKPSDLVDGKCPDHGEKPEVVEEENWFFRLTKYRGDIQKAIESEKLRILPTSRKNETLEMLKEMEDVSFSRPRKDLSWGIPVPNDDTQTMYVWCDALANYVSALGYGRDNTLMDFWPADIHLLGKDIMKFHTIIWPAMLLSAGLEMPKSIYVHGHITQDGQKMSKSLGNVVDPFVLAEKYGVDPVRYFLLREIPSGEDGDFSEKKLEERYTSDLANGLGNLVQRVATLISTKLEGEINYSDADNEQKIKEAIDKTKSKTGELIDSFKLHEALTQIWNLIGTANSYINENKPWELNDKPEEFIKVLANSTELVIAVAELLSPFIPQTSEKILKRFSKEKTERGSKVIVSSGEILFPQLN